MLFFCLKRRHNLLAPKSFGQSSVFLLGVNWAPVLGRVKDASLNRLVDLAYEELNPLQSLFKGFNEFHAVHVFFIGEGDRLLKGLD
ncbi:MAG: hypothetical protein NWE87_07975 [Candidatus Bathyarchaeota archaeon]|nr:hypothetical protein [Candidatus Bathyarchaeota archaeon]